MPSAINQKRAEDGRQAVQLHADWRAIENDHIDFQTCANDMVANILHAVFGVAPEVRVYHHAEAEAFLNRALVSWIGDTEDEDPGLEDDLRLIRKYNDDEEQ